MNHKYKNIAVILIAILVIGLNSADVSRSEVYSMHEFAPDYFPVNERVDYVIKHLDSEKSGEAMFAIKKITQFDTDLFLLRYESTDGEKNKTNWDVKVRMDNLAPFSFELNIEKAERAFNYHGAISSGEITINVRATDAEPREIIYSRGSKFYVSMILPYLLRNIEYVTDDWYTFSMLDVETAKFNTPIVQVKDKEVVEVPAGIYDCYKVSIKIGGDQHWAWYSVKKPHYLVRYRYPDKELVMKRHY